MAKDSLQYFTRYPNEILDRLHLLSPIQERIITRLVRETYGWEMWYS